MKKLCPYCAEEIEENAIKCKHCGEWLDNRKKSSLINKTKSLLKKSKSFIDNQAVAYIERKYKHLYSPTENKPFKIGDVLFFPDKMEYRGENYNYSEIAHIKYKSTSQYINGIKGNEKIDFEIYFEFKNKSQNLSQVSKKVINLTKLGFMGFGKKRLEKITFINNYLKEKTFKLRLDRYLTQIEINGYFKYPNGDKIYNNGDVERYGNIQTNIFKAYENKRLDYGGGGFTGILGRSKISNPYKLYIWDTQSKIKFAFLSGNFNIDVLYDKDVFDTILNILLNDGKILN